MKSTSSPMLRAIAAVASLLLASCGGGSQSPQQPPHVSEWTWVSGANVFNQDGVYGTQGVASPSNVPGARESSVSWTDSQGNFWLFGGLYELPDATQGVRNDLWKFDGSNWTWMGGPEAPSQIGVYGTQGTASPTNIPGARVGAASSLDKNGNLWTFGGFGNDAVGSRDNLNDLWKFDGSNWTWISGADIPDQRGVYGVQGVPSPSNVPGARQGAVSWIDAAGNFWLFAGYGLASSGSVGVLNDLWKFDGTNWTWVGGASTTNQPGVYGTQGTPFTSNVPGGRNVSVAWTDSGGHFWLFGGGGVDSAGTSGPLNDLWKFDGSSWTWVGGANIANQAGVYGTKGTGASSNIPGARSGAAEWVDTKGNLWMFGGVGVDSTGNRDVLSDLWKFDGSNWTWMSGPNIANQVGIYGTQGTPSASNIPGSRKGAAAWLDKNGNLWLFGGLRFDFPPGNNEFDDLWRFAP